MRPFEVCPVCGGELVAKDVEKIVRGGGNTAVLRLQAEVCTGCGERLYTQDTIRDLERIRAALTEQRVDGMEAIGTTYRVA